MISILKNQTLGTLNKKITFVPLVGALIALSLNAQPAIYESFDYTDGALAGNGTGTTGLAGDWTSSTSSNPQAVFSPGLSFNNLSTTGGAVQRPSLQGADFSQVQISAGAQSTLTADNSTIYFSFLVRTDFGNEKFDNNTFYLGTSDAPDAAWEPRSGDDVTPGSGFGFVVNGQDDSSRFLQGFASDGVGTSLTTGSLASYVNDDPAETLMIAGQIDWAANGSNDVMTLWNVVDPSAGLGTNLVSLSADLDQSTFDTLTILSRQRGSFDEIRFGTSLADVSVIPEPSAFALLSGLLGLGWVMLRRR